MRKFHTTVLIHRCQASSVYTIQRYQITRRQSYTKAMSISTLHLCHALFSSIIRLTSQSPPIPAIREISDAWQNPTHPRNAVWSAKDELLSHWRTRQVRIEQDTAAYPSAIDHRQHISKIYTSKNMPSRPSFSPRKKGGIYLRQTLAQNNKARRAS